MTFKDRFEALGSIVKLIRDIELEDYPSAIERAEVLLIGLKGLLRRSENP